MNAKITPVSRTACDPSQYTCIPSVCMAYEYGRFEKVSAKPLLRVPTVLFGWSAGGRDEPSMNIFLILALGMLQRWLGVAVGNGAYPDACRSF